MRGSASPFLTQRAAAETQRGEGPRPDRDGGRRGRCPILRRTRIHSVRRRSGSQCVPCTEPQHGLARACMLQACVPPKNKFRGHQGQTSARGTKGHERKEASNSARAAAGEEAKKSTSNSNREHGGRGREEEGPGPLKSRQGSSLRALGGRGSAGLASQNPTTATGLKAYN